MTSSRTVEGIWIAGMPRSGTGWLMKELMTAGANGGDANDDSTKLEDPIVSMVNHRLLNAEGGSHMDPPRQLFVPEETNFQQIIREMLRFHDALRPVVMKHPPIAITYPVWNYIRPSWPLVATVRHPMACARSNSLVYQAMSLNACLELWLRYMSDLLLWSQVYDEVSWVMYPEGTGLSAAQRRLGLEVGMHKMSPKSVHQEPEPLPNEWGHCGQIYELICKKAGDAC